MPEPRPSQRATYRAATRANLLAVARRLFLAEGVEAVSMDTIAIAAEVSRATIYQHFAGKPSLLEALLIEDWEKQASLFARLGDLRTRPDAETLRVWLRRVVEGMRRASGSFALHRAALGQNEVMATRHTAHRQRLAGLLRESLGAGGDDPRQTVELAMVVAEIEYLATAALSEWSFSETEIAITIMTERLVAVQGRALTISLDINPSSV
jgi:AcrR family transcriptional regulator